jgi:hypothetical protein
MGYGDGSPNPNKVIIDTPDKNVVPGTLDRVTMGIDLVSGSSGTFDDPVQYAPSDGSHNVVTSLTKSGWHAPVLDIDIPCTYVPSTTEGHGHLYIDKELTLPQYIELMEVLVRLGIVERGFLISLEQRGFTAVRLPWIKKPSKYDPWNEGEKW